MDDKEPVSARAAIIWQMMILILLSSKQYSIKAGLTFSYLISCIHVSDVIGGLEAKRIHRVNHIPRIGLNIPKRNNSTLCNESSHHISSFLLLESISMNFPIKGLSINTYTEAFPTNLFVEIMFVCIYFQRK